jgi:hypothetical protein
VESRAVEPDVELGSWRWLRWYPLAAAVLLGLLYWLAPRHAREPKPVQAPPKQAIEPAAAEAIEVPQTEAPEERGWIAERAASAVASALSERVGAGLSALRGHFDREDLKEGGLKAARLAPFVGPFLRYQRARASYASDDAQVRAAAERQTVVALAELALDASVTGVGHVAGDSEGLMHLVEGAVDVADMVDLGLSIQREFGAPLGDLAIGRLDDRIDQLAGLALERIDGLAPFVRSLLTAEVSDWRKAVPDEAIPYVEKLLEHLPDVGTSGG